MFDDLIRRWWILAGRGVVAVALGLALLLARVETLGLLVSLFGVFALADGLFLVITGLAVGWLALFLEGIVGMIVGAFTFLYPPATELYFMELIVAWGVATGALELVGAFRLKDLVPPKMARDAWTLAGVGVASLLFAVLVALWPELGAFTGLLGGYAILSGALLMFLGVDIRTWGPGRPAGPAGL